MTTRDFIKRNYMVESNKPERHCSSVLADSFGNIYSYGSHYPLAFRIKGLDFINEAGYSATTGKHIGWARSALDYQYVGVKLDRDQSRIISRFYYDDQTKIAVVRAALEREYISISNEMSNKKRTNTDVYRRLLIELDEVRENLRRVREVQ